MKNEDVNKNEGVQNIIINVLKKEKRIYGEPEKIIIPAISCLSEFLIPPLVNQSL